MKPGSKTPRFHEGEERQKSHPLVIFLAMPRREVERGDHGTSCGSYGECIYFFSSISMKTVNKVMLLGNATRDPELKSTATGQSVCTIGLATNRVWKDAQGARQSLAEFHNLVAWGRLAEFCAGSIKKGKPLYIEGYLKTRNWDAPDGHKMHRTEIVIEDLVLLSPREEGELPSEPDRDEVSQDIPGQE